MGTPAVLVEWLSEKTEAHLWAGVREARSVTHTWRRHTGGRITSATLSASIAPSKEFSITVEHRSVEPEYIAATKNGVVSVLLAQSWSPILCCSVTLVLQPSAEESSYASFFAVAKEATEQLLGVAPGFTHNIAWGKRGA